MGSAIHEGGFWTPADLPPAPPPHVKQSYMTYQFYLEGSLDALEKALMLERDRLTGTSFFWDKALRQVEYLLKALRYHKAKTPDGTWRASTKVDPIKVEAPETALERLGE